MTTRQLIAAGLCLVPVLLWTLITRQLWAFRDLHVGKSRAFRLLPVVATALAVHYAALLLRVLTPGTMPHDPVDVVRSPWHATSEITWLIAIALMRHLLRLLPLPETRPGRGWVAINYGLAAGGAGAALALRLWPSGTVLYQELAHRVFEIGFVILGALCLWEFWRNARPGVWGPEHAGDLLRFDVLFVAAGVATALIATGLVWLAGGGDFATVVFEVILGIAIAVPFSARMLGWIVPEIVVGSMVFVVTTGFFIVHGEALSRLASAYHPLATVSAVLATLVALGAGAPWLRETVTRTLLRRRRREAQDLQAALHALSPELGVVECARQALAALTRIRQLPGAAILFVDGEALIHGRFRLEPLLRAWPRGEEAARLPRGVYDSLELRELKLAMREALVESNVGLGVAAIDSPRRRWGHLFLQAGFLGGSFRIDDVDQFAAFVDQLALRLDAADLLARALAVERSLAHAEKLAAIGELAARFAHDIRNPVTAARSLAQQLARDPTAPANAEHAGIILAELERVERRVRDLLRFARREELRVEPTEVGALVRAAVEPFASRCAAGGVTLAVEAPEPVVVPVDAEKLRLALANLIENALDAVAGAAAKRVAIAVGRANGRATVRVSDSGPGVPDDALPHLFEPFYSRKSHGTGLGLAIAKRTVDAHGGAIAAHQPPGEGLTFTIELPLHAPG